LSEDLLIFVGMHLHKEEGTRSQNVPRPASPSGVFCPFTSSSSFLNNHLHQVCSNLETTYAMQTPLKHKGLRMAGLSSIQLV
jgi:hypothetical protein